MDQPSVLADLSILLETVTFKACERAVVQE